MGVSLMFKMRKVTEDEVIQHEKNIENYGYTLVPKFIPTDDVELILKRVNHLFSLRDNNGYSGVPDRDVKDKIIYNLQNKHISFIRLFMDPFIRNLLIKKLNDPFYRFLPQDVPNYILNYFNARSSGEALDLHIDSHIPAISSQIWAMQVAFILEEQNEKNGCTVVVPGSHLSGKYTDRAMKDVKPIISKPGDLVIWDSRLWHGTLKNKANVSRWSLIATFTSWWLKQSMDITRSLPEEIYKSLNNEEKSILGFCSIPPASELNSINTKTGYESLRNSVSEYYAP